MLPILTACSKYQVYFGDMRQVETWDSSRESLSYVVNVFDEQDNTYGILTANTSYSVKLIARFNTEFRHETLPVRIKVMKFEERPDGNSVVTRILLAKRAEIATREYHGKALGDTNMDTSTVEALLGNFNVEFSEPGRYNIILSLDSDFKAEGLLAIGLELVKPIM